MFVWNGSPDLISIGPITIRWYGLLFALGFYFGMKIMAWEARTEKLKIGSLDSLLIYMVIGTIAGARLGHTLIYEPEIYLADPIRIFKVWEGGLASHGGSVGVMLGVWLWKRKHFEGSLLELLDYLCMPAALTAGFIRIGNFFNSEIIGRPTSVPWAVIFKRVDHLPRHPSMLYESFAYFVTLGTIFFIFKKKWHRGRPGLILGVFFIMVFGARFFIEFLKELQVASEARLPMDLGQLLSVPFVVAGIVLVVLAARRKVVKKR
ncbi:MAG: prolipoprotein diacylglyceryl transferase [Oligoflexia bacterium]|nr:prolipoprotein diacylglyceryl transferase [Oligoflexia bacterium]